LLQYEDMEKSRKKKVILWAAVIISVSLIALFTYIPFAVMNPMVDRHVDFDEVWSATDFGIIAKPFFVTSEDGLRIAAHEVGTDDPKNGNAVTSRSINPRVSF
jgi:hypothetical protein